MSLFSPRFKVKREGQTLFPFIFSSKRIKFLFKFNYIKLGRAHKIESTFSIWLQLASRYSSWFNPSMEFCLMLSILLWLITIFLSFRQSDRFGNPVRILFWRYIYLSSYCRENMVSKFSIILILLWLKSIN